MSPWTKRILFPLGIFQAYAEDKSSRITIRSAPTPFRLAARLVPMAPAPPVTRTALPPRPSDTSEPSVGNPIYLPHPLYGSPYALGWGDLWIMLEVTNRFRAID